MVDKEKLSQMIQAEVRRIGLRPLARELQVAAPSLMNYIHRSVTPSTQALEKLAKYFRVHTTYFYAGEMETNPQPESEYSVEDVQFLKIVKELRLLSPKRYDALFDYATMSLERASREYKPLPSLAK